MKKRLKIAEQILIVLLLALILPLIIAAAIIINTNQIAVRKELSYSATIIAKSVSDELISLQNFEHNSLFYVNEALKKISKSKEQKAFLTQIKK